MIIYTDGSCKKNPGGPGGFSVIILDDNENFIDCYAEHTEDTTNNREELKGILYAYFKYGVNIDEEFQPNIPIVYSDSAYSINTFSSWMFNWALKGWLKSDNQTPENLDLIKPYYNYWQRGFRINLKKVKGHIGNQWNEIADKLATGKLTINEVKEKYKRKEN